MEAICHAHMHLYKGGQRDCGQTACPIYYWMPYRTEAPSYEWEGVSPRKEGLQLLPTAEPLPLAPYGNFVCRFNAETKNPAAGDELDDEDELDGDELDGDELDGDELDGDDLEDDDLEDDDLEDDDLEDDDDDGWLDD